MAQKNTPLSGTLRKTLHEAAKEYDELQSWFEELRDRAGLSPGADRGAVAKALIAKTKELEGALSEQREVATHYGYKKWGNLLNHVRNTTVRPSAELPVEFEKVPVLWFAGRGKPSYDECERKLRKAVQPLVLRWLSENPDHTQEELEELATIFTDSESPQSFVQILGEDFTREAQEETDTDRLTLAAAVEQLRDSLLPHVSSEEDLKWFVRHDSTVRAELIREYEAALVMGGPGAKSVVRALFEAAAFELAGFSGARGAEPPEWRALQVNGELPMGDQLSEVLERGVPRSREEWLQLAAPALE